MINFIKNLFYPNRYKGHPEAIIISCFFNPQNSPYRIKAFKKFYEDIKHLNHYIIECVIGDAKPQLEENANIKRVYTQNLLWHKEALLNKIVSELPKKYKYVFWLDADVIFTNKNWLVEGVKQLEDYFNIIQPFEWCVHLDRDQLEPSFSVNTWKTYSVKDRLKAKMWRSFSANYETANHLSNNESYDVHGHVGFAWGAKREVLDKAPLYDKALIGGADHIIAHASAGHIPNSCIEKSFTDNLEEVNEWSRKFYSVVKGRIGYVKGDLYHIWHGDIDKRQYLKRIQDFTHKTKNISEKDKNGLYITNKKDDEYLKSYFKHREVSQDDNFLTSVAMGYATNSTIMGTALGGNPLGAMIGDMMNDSENKQAESHHHNCACPTDSIPEVSSNVQSDNTPTDTSSSTFS